MNDFINQLNSLVLEEIKKYQNLSIYHQKVNTPYYINNLGKFVFTPLLSKMAISEEQKKLFLDSYKNREVPFGWYRGKGTPKELEDAVIQISAIVDLKLENANSTGIVDFMKLYGLGIDCSGFVYNVLSSAFTKFSQETQFKSSLAWANPEKQIASYAGAFVFGDPASELIENAHVQPLDLILFPDENSYNHIALIVMIDNQFYVAQSNLDCIPNGINVSLLKIQDNCPYFHYEPTIGKDWNLVYKEGQMEIRRLKILKTLL